MKLRLRNKRTTAWSLLVPFLTFSLFLPQMSSSFPSIPEDGSSVSTTTTMTSEAAEAAEASSDPVFKPLSAEEDELYQPAKIESLCLNCQSNVSEYQKGPKR